MFASSAKRRKTSPYSSITVDASNTNPDPSTSKRASFQSPTKSSLARSHPGILSRSPGRSHAAGKEETRPQEAIAQNTSQNISGESISAPQTPKQREELADEIALPATTAAVPLESFSTAISRTFTNPPPRVSRGRSPLRTRQPPIQLVNKEQHPESRASDRNLQSKVHDRIRRRKPDLENEEPELPPTPVQLGLESQPQRPRGLASSSPKGPRSSSGSNRRRSRMNASQTSSPLKPKAKELHENNEQDELSTADVRSKKIPPQEAPESDAEELGQEDVELPEELQEKRTLQVSLSAQLARLKADLTRLEAAVKTTSNPQTSLNVDQDFIALLTTTNPSCAEPNPDHNIRSQSPILQNPVTNLGANPIPFLSLFAPGNLKLETKTSTSIIQGRPHQEHILMLCAPDPWPKSVFNMKLHIAVDIENHQINSIEVVDFEPVLSHHALKQWIEKRLQSKLYKHDVGSLIWGIGSWWDECVRRAIIWRAFEKRYVKELVDEETQELLNPNFNASKVDPSQVKPSEVHTLLVHTDRTSMEILIKKVPKLIRSHAKDARVRMFISWKFADVSWTGGVVEQLIDITATGVNRIAAANAKAVSETLIKSEGGVVRAAETVWRSFKREVNPD